MNDALAKWHHDRLLVRWGRYPHRERFHARVRFDLLCGRYYGSGQVQHDDPPLDRRCKTCVRVLRKRLA